MAETPFVHLHCHTDYSLLDGACEIGQLMDLAAEQKMPALAMTDHGNLFGAVQFYNEAKKRNIHPVLGCEVYVSQKGHKTRSDTDRYNHLVLLCENQEGYRNLIDLVSTAYLEGFYYKPRIDKDLLAQKSKGLIALSACLRGDINETLMADRYDEGLKLAYDYRDMFGRENFFLEVQDHGLDQDKVVIPHLNRMSSQTGIPLVATNDSHYLRKKDARAHEILMCIQTGKTMSDANRMKFTHPEFYLKSRAEMMQLFGEMEDAVNRPWDIAQRCQVKIEKVKEPFPKFDVPPAHTVDSYFEYVAREGFEKRRGRLEAMAAQGKLRCPLEAYAERLDFEIKMIQKMKFSGYFLIVWDFIFYSKNKNIPVGPGRGSAAGSLVSYVMQITDIDPLQYGLLFERFLNPERVSMPDIDIDFCMNRRGEVIQYVTQKYGREQVAQIITFNTLGARGVIKDVGRALDLAYGDVEKVTKLVPGVLNIELKKAFEMEPGFKDAANKDPRIKDVLDVAVTLEGLARNSSVHAAGVVIAPQPLKELVPLYKTGKDEIVTQYDMSGLDKLGLLKMDFLGLTTLTLIDDALKLIEKRHGVKLVLEDLPLDDPKSYEVFCKGFTSGIFQFESPGMRDILRKYQPSRLEDLTALNALYRPGPIQGGMLDDFIERKHGRKAVVYDLADLKPILEETYGVILYQEQVMQISSRIAGYSLGDADLLRRAMGKKNADEMAKQKDRFVAGGVKAGYAQKKVEKIFDLMAQFAGYGFNKSHSAAYAFLAFATAYLKAHFPVDFMAALLTSETGNVSKVVKYINECRDMNIEVLAPDVNASDKNFTPDGEAIRFGMGAVKNVGEGAIEAIVAARRECGRFTSIYQLCEKVNLAALNRRVLESLIKAGAMDSLTGSRSQVFAAVEGAMESGQRAQRDLLSGQEDLFGMLAVEEAHEEKALPNVPPWTPKEILQGEKEMLGFYVTGHPLDQYDEKIREVSKHDSSKLEGLAKGAEVAMCGVLTSIQKRRNREQKPWASMTIEDRMGSTEAMVFSTQYDKLVASLVEDQVVLVRGLALPEDGAPTKISVQDVIPLDLVRVSVPSLISIKVFLNRNGVADKAGALQELFGKKPGNTQVRLRLENPREFAVTLDIEAKIKPDREFKAEVERICGPDAIEVLANA
jgi:DNA polymerase-3 subunit alpha